MPSVCAVLPEFPAFAAAPAGAKASAPRRDPGRSRFEAKVSRSFQAQALRWLDAALDRYPGLAATCRKNRITVSPLSLQGFAVTLSIEGGRCKVMLGPCHEEFGSLKEATGYMTAAVGGELRLRIDLARRPHRWSVERRLPNGSWIGDGTFEDASAPTPRPPRTSCYFRNQVEPER